MLISRKDKKKTSCSKSAAAAARNLCLAKVRFTHTRVSAPAAAPRSYIVEGEGGRTIRRNRRDIIAFPSEDEAAQHEGDGHVPAVRDDVAVFTRCGRQVKAPD